MCECLTNQHIDLGSQKGNWRFFLTSFMSPQFVQFVQIHGVWLPFMLPVATRSSTGGCPQVLHHPEDFYW